MELIRSIAELQQSSRWFWVYCEGERCGHSSAMAIAPLIIRWGPETSPDLLRRSARCTRCGRKRATLRHPSWASTIVGFEEFPAERAAPALVSFVC